MPDDKLNIEKKTTFLSFFVFHSSTNIGLTSTRPTATIVFNLAS